MGKPSHFVNASYRLSAICELMAGAPANDPMEAITTNRVESSGGAPPNTMGRDAPFEAAASATPMARSASAERPDLNGDARSAAPHRRGRERGVATRDLVPAFTPALGYESGNAALNSWASSGSDSNNGGDASAFFSGVSRPGVRIVVVGWKSAATKSVAVA